MRKLLVIIALLSLTVCAEAQNARQEIKKNPRVSASGYLAYPGPQHRLTPAPKGYKPFYLSHYGRHGSRYLIGTADYDRAYLTLMRADSLGQLTAKGREVLGKVAQIRQEAMHRDAELTQRGAEQHREIARRMWERFPEVFEGKTNVDAKSTVVIRCILSMENALQELVRLNPQLNITHDASQHDMYYMNQDDKVLYKQKMAGGTKELLDSFKRRHRDDSHMLGLIFRDPNWLGKAKADKLADRLFKLASNVQSTELRHQLSLYDIFTDEELYQHWLCNNAFWYLTYGPSTVNGGNQPFSQRNLLHKIISQADSCIALPHPGATLRYGHDTMVMPLVCLLDLNGYGRPVSDIEQLPTVGWCDYRIFPMACNVQWIFYRRSVDDKDVLVKILLNEDEARLPISTDCAPYYHWSDVRRYYLDKLASYKPQPLQK